MHLFAHRLAIALGVADVSGLLDSLPQRAWLDWIAYFEKEPWGEARADTRAAITSALLFNLNRGRGQPARPVSEFMAHRPSRADATGEHLAALKGALMGLARKRTDADTN